MDYRRNEGFIRQSSSLRFRDPYENDDRVEASHRSLRRSGSPSELAHEAGVSQMMGSVERRDHGWPLDRGRIGRVRSRSPPPIDLGDAWKRPHYDGGGIPPRNFSPTPFVELRQRRELSEGKNLNFASDDPDFHNIRAYRYERSDPRISKEESDEMGLSEAGGKHQLLDQNSAPAKDLARGSYHLPTHIGSTATLIYGDGGGKLPISSRAMDTQHFEQGRIQYQDTMALDRLPGNHSYKDGEKPVMHSRDVSYHHLSGPNSKVLASSSAEMSRHEYMSYQDNLHLPHASEFKNGVKLNEPTSVNVYSERLLLDCARDPEGSQRNHNFYLREYSPDKGEQENYVYLKSREMVDDRGYSADDHKRIAPRGQLEYGRTQIIYDRRDMSRPSMTHSAVDRNDNIDGPTGDLRQGITYYQPALENQTDSDYLDMRRTTHNMSKQGREYLGSGFTHHDIGRAVSHNHEIMHVGAPNNHRISGLEADYGFGGHAGSQFQEERLMGSPVRKYENEMNRHDVRMQKMRNEHGMYKLQDRVLKGKYSIQEHHARSYNPRKNLSSEKFYSTRHFQDLQETDEEWINEEMSDSYTSRKRGFEQPRYRTERRYDEMGNHEDFQSDDWFPSQGSSHGRKQQVGFHKHYGQQFKGNNRRPGYVSYHNLHHFDRKDHQYRQRNQYDRKNHLYRQNNYYDRKDHNYSQQKVSQRNDGYFEDLQAEDRNNGSDPSEDWVSHEEAALDENTEEFKQLVHEALLKYSRMLNMNPAVRRRYKEEGKAGTLFCVVCGRSASKEFMDTRRLVTHAFMSHKAGLRVDHLGLHKAICILLGWSTVIPEDTITWSPQVLPRAQALAQKEDLIIWPPVIVVHNISFSDSNPEKWKVVTMEALEAFVRGKGFIRGRIRVCLGKPADQSVMVVKFLGTFTGLGDAEKLHKYLAEQKRGRVDLEMETSNSNGISINEEAENLEENILYGYLGTSEDLDKVDYMTRNTGLIKSKIEIQDLANAPVKPEETLQ